MPLTDIHSHNEPKIPLTLSMWQKAKDFADKQINYQKAQQVYLNVLAVLSVNQYLQRTGIQTDLENSNGYNLAMQTMLDNAELYIPEYGVIDCRPTILSESLLMIPEEIRGTAMLHLAVAISKDFESAQLLGFTPQVEKEQIPLKQLQPIVDLPTFFTNYRSRVAFDVQKTQQSLLSRWLSGGTQEGWSDLTSLVIQKLNLNILDTSERSLAFRNSTASPATATKDELINRVSKVKLWELNHQGQKSKIAIIVSFTPTAEEEVDISIQIFPTDDNIYLPVGFIIQILDDNEKIILQVETTSNNDKIEFYLSGQPQEIFTIQGIYGRQLQTEKFVI